MSNVAEIVVQRCYGGYGYSVLLRNKETRAFRLMNSYNLQQDEAMKMAESLQIITEFTIVLEKADDR